jgi:pseudouridine kinase
LTSAWLTGEVGRVELYLAGIAPHSRGSRGGMAAVMVIGGAHVDRQARLIAPHVAATSNPVNVFEEAGGGGFNAARAMRRLKCDVSLVSTRGADSAAAMVEAALAASGIADMSSVHLDRATPSYTAVLQPDGELVTAIADMALYEAALGKTLRRSPVRRLAAKVDAILCDANLPEAAIEGVFALAGAKPVYALAISAGKAARLEPYLARLSALFLNRHEANVFTGLGVSASAAAHAVALYATGIPRVVVTAGADPAACWDGRQLTEIAPPPIDVADVTGAGDALAGTTIAFLLEGMSFVEAACQGMAAAALTAARQGASPLITPHEIKALAATLHVVGSAEWKGQTAP